MSNIDRCVYDVMASNTDVTNITLFLGNTNILQIIHMQNIILPI